MPYVRLDISPKLADQRLVDELLVPINRLIAERLSIPIEKVKTTVQINSYHCVGDNRAAQVAYLTLQLFSGRPAELRADLSRALYRHLEEHWDASHPGLSIAVYVIEIDQVGTTTAQYKPNP